MTLSSLVTLDLSFGKKGFGRATYYAVAVRVNSKDIVAETFLANEYVHLTKPFPGGMMPGPTTDHCILGEVGPNHVET